MVTNPENQIPEQMDFMVTAKCNALCEMCIQEVTPKLVGSDEVFEEGARRHFNEYYRCGGRKAVITGGEPTLAMKRVLTVLDMLSDYPDLELVGIYTNGSRLLLIECGFDKTILERLAEGGIISINQSVHHYDVEKNSTINSVFRIPVTDPRVTAKHMRALGIPFRYNATLQKGFLETAEDVLRYLDFAEARGAEDVYFRELFQLNVQYPISVRGQTVFSYSEIHRIPIEPILEELEKRGYRRTGERTDFQGRSKKEVEFRSPDGFRFYISKLEIGSEDSSKFPYIVVMPDGHIYSTWLGIRDRIG